MNRDEIILSCQDLVNNLVRKYNNHYSDEDLQSIGMIGVVKCVDRCLKDEMTDLNEIQARCNVWARNEILTEIYKEKIKYSDDEFALENIESPEEVSELLISVRQSLTPRQLEVFELLINGYDYNEIMTKLNIQKSQLYEHIKNIKNKISENRLGI